MRKEKIEGCKAGFTLAETMIVLVVLGVIAVVTVPALINKHIESANRTKIKKAMAVYDTALNKMVIENGIKDNAALYENANSFAPENNCTNTAPYFKVSTVLNNNICTFKAPDGLFWNISKINAPILAFNEDDLNNEDAQNRFQLVGHFDDTTGSLRVNDLQYETGDNKIALQKTYNYINSIKENGEMVNVCDERCQIKKYSEKECENALAREGRGAYESGGCINCTTCKIIERRNENSTMLYDENGHNVIVGYFCDEKGEKCRSMDGMLGYDYGYNEYIYECSKDSDGYYNITDCVRVPKAFEAGSGSGSGSGY